MPTTMTPMMIAATPKDQGDGNMFDMGAASCLCRVMLSGNGDGGKAILSH
jgi:hypothetical protein